MNSETAPTDPPVRKIQPPPPRPKWIPEGGLTCLGPGCGKPIPAGWYGNRRKNYFCSNRCETAYYWSKRPLVRCAVCKKPFHRGYPGHKLCSRACFSVWRKGTTEQTRGSVLASAGGVPRIVSAEEQSDARRAQVERRPPPHVSRQEAHSIGQLRSPGPHHRVPEEHPRRRTVEGHDEPGQLHQAVLRLDHRDGEAEDGEPGRAEVPRSEEDETTPAPVQRCGTRRHLATARRARRQSPDGRGGLRPAGRWAHL